MMPTWELRNKRTATLLRRYNQLLLELKTPINKDGKMFSDHLDVTEHGEEKIIKAMDEWVGGKLVQEAFPFLSPDSRDFLLMPSFVLGV